MYQFPFPGWFDDKSALIQVMAWHQTGDDYFSEIYVQHVPASHYLYV